MGISNSVKKAGAVIISAAMLTSLASCAGLFGGQAVIDAAESLGDAVIAGDSGKIIKLSTEDKDSEIAEALDLILDDDNYSDDYLTYIDAMNDTMSYEVDKGSVKVDGKKASCDITFTMADYEDLDDGEYEDIDDIVDAVGDLDTKEYEFTVKFTKDGDDWLVSNLSSDDFGALFDYRSYSLPVTNVAGDYAAVLDLTDVMNDSLTGSLGTDIAMQGSVEMAFYLTLAEDGTFSFSYDAASLVDSVMNYIDVNLDAIFMSAFGATSVDELETYAVLLGYASYDEMKSDLGEQITESISADDLDDSTVTGTYTVDGNELVMTAENEYGTALPTSGTIENGNIIIEVDVNDDEVLGSDSIELVFEPAA